jgi:hypothetical protein
MDRFASAAVSLYGIIDHYDFSDLYNNWNRKKTNPDDIVWVLEMFIGLGRCNYTLWNNSIAHKSFRKDGFEEAERMLERLKKLPLYIPSSKKDFLKYADPKYYEITHAHALLLAFLKNNAPGADKVPILPKLILDGIHRLALHNRPAETFMRNLEHSELIFDLDKTNALLSLVMDARNNTRIWGNNGWTPTELMEMRRRGELALNGDERIVVDSLPLKR